MRIVVTGATGTVGREVVSALRGRADVRACCRRVAETSLPKDVHPVAFDLERPETFADVCADADAVFWLTPLVRDPAPAVARALDAAARAGVRRIVMLSARSVLWDHRSELRRAQREVEAELLRRPFDHTILRPCSFAQNLVGDPATFRARARIAMPSGDGAIPFVDALDLGEAAAACLLEPARHRNRAYTLTGAVALTGREAAACASEALGTPIEFVDVPRDRARADALARGVADFVVDAGLAVYDHAREGGEAATSPDLTEILGRAPTSLATFFARYSAAG